MPTALLTEDFSIVDTDAGTDALLCQALDHAMRALDRAEEAGHAAALSLAFAEVARCHRAMGLLEPAEWYLQQALKWARMLGAVDSSIDLLCELADIAVSRAAKMAPQEARRAHMALELARDHAYEASELARQCADPHWEVNVLMRVSETLNLCGDHDDALALQCRALHLIVQTSTGLTVDSLPPIHDRAGPHKR